MVIYKFNGNAKISANAIPVSCHKVELEFEHFEFVLVTKLIATIDLNVMVIYKFKGKADILSNRKIANIIALNSHKVELLALASPGELLRAAPLRCSLL